MKRDDNDGGLILFVLVFGIFAGMVVAGLLAKSGLFIPCNIATHPTQEADK